MCKFEVGGVYGVYGTIIIKMTRISASRKTVWFRDAGDSDKEQRARITIRRCFVTAWSGSLSRYQSQTFFNDSAEPSASTSRHGISGFFVAMKFDRLHPFFPNIIFPKLLGIGALIDFHYKI